MKKFTNLDDIIEKSLKWPDGKECQEFDCDVTLFESMDDVSMPMSFKAYTVTISNRNITFFSNNGCLDYVIDSYGDKHFLCLMNIDR